LFHWRTAVWPTLAGFSFFGTFKENEDFYVQRGRIDYSGVLKQVITRRLEREAGKTWISWS
jgi:hypothetical protein